MILVDASFILELLVRNSKGLTSDDLLAVEPRAAAVSLDLLLFENQLPFFVIEKLYQLASPSLIDANPCPSNYNCLLKLYINYFSGSSTIEFIQPLPNVKIEYFTDLLRTYQLPPPGEQPKRHRQPIKHLYSATQLHEAGVKFEAEFQTPYILFELGRVLAFMVEQASLPNSMTAVEAIVASRAVTFAKEIGLNSIVLDGDSLKNDKVSLIDYSHLIEEAKDVAEMYNNVGTQPGVPRPPVNAANAPPNPFGNAFYGAGSGLIRGGLGAYGEKILGLSYEYVQSNISEEPIVRGQAFFHQSLLLQTASILYVTSLCLQENIPNDAEAIAALRTITFAPDLGFSNVIVEGDSETVIKAFKSEESFASFGHLVSTVKLIVESFNQISFSHTEQWLIIIYRHSCCILLVITYKEKGFEGDNEEAIKA
ncbi:hypothetical protein SO802_021960 [Lithocarpus litseifolius]|uniref:RNase H type-1 domain-containing protein n=1 Tax=Lithocarpus litseifolius TaxID=425828 RepID=A0AAW2CJ95_9ROSI